MRRISRSLVLLLALGPAAVLAQPSFTKAFGPSTIGPGSATTLEYTITNASGSAVTQLAFTDAFPTGLLIASPANASSTCTGGGGRDGASPVIDAPEGGSTLAYSGGGIGASSACVVRVDVTRATPGTVTSTSSILISTAGTSAAATADLTVATDRPGFSASLSPTSVTLNGRSTLTYVLDNTQNLGAAYLGGFTHDLPAGLTIGSPSNAGTTCDGATVAAAAGSGTVTLTGNSVTPLASGTSCTVSVDVEGNAIGRLANASGDLNTAATIFGPPRSSGVAGVALDVLREALLLTKAFPATPVPPGGSVEMTLSLRNLDRNGTATSVAFSDDLEATLPGLVATGLPVAACGGTLSSPDGGSTIELVGGVLASGEACELDVTLAVPPAAATGSYTNTTSQASAIIDGEAVLGSPGVAEVIVAAAPRIATSFTDDPVAAGGTATLEYTVTNTSLTSAATGITFSNVLSGIFGDTFTATLPAGGFCGIGSNMQLTGGFPGNPRSVVVSGGSLDPGASCTVSLAVDVPLTVTGGVYTNTTSPVTATVDGLTLSGDAASDDLVVIDVPTLSKAFPDGAVAPGGVSLVRFTLQFDTEAEEGATSLSFSDDLDAMLPGLVASGLPFGACGGTVSSPDLGSTLEFSGGALGANEDCTFDVPLDIPVGAPSGIYTNTTSEVTATVSGVEVTALPASADLVVTALTFTKSFVDDPTAPGGSVTLAYTLSNDDPSADVTGLLFTDDLSGALSGLASTSGTVSDGCGSGSSLSGTTSLVFAGGSLAAGSSCTVSVSLDVPLAAPPSSYLSTTSPLSATFDGTSTVLPGASDVLTVATDTPPLFSKAFAPTVVAEGEGSTVVLTIDNSASVGAATGLEVTDGLPAGLTVATPANGVSTCAGGTLDAVGGATSVSYVGGSVAGGETCTVSFDVSPPTVGTYVNTTSDLTSSLGNSGSASASLDVRALQLSATKTVAILDDDGDGLADPGETLRYTITVANSADRESTALTFDDLPDSHTSLVPGSVTTSQGTVSSTSPSVTVDLGPVAPSGGTAIITFDAAVDMPLATGVAEVCNQGSITGFSVSLLTDDPATPGLDGATCLTTDPNEPPVADAGEDQTVECEAPGGTAVTLDGIGSTDPDGDDLAYEWTGPFVEGGGVVSGAEPTITLGLGEHVVMLTVTDPSGESDADEVTLTIEDTLPPVVTLNGDAELTLVRFSGPYVEAGASAEDACEGPLTVTVDGTVDTTIPGVSVITYTATDSAGNGAEATRTVTVLDDPAAIVSPYLVLADDDVVIDAQARTEGDVHSNDRMEFKKGLALDEGGPSLHVGTLTAVDDIKIHDRQRIEGDVRADRVDLKNGAVVTGTVIQSAAPAIALPTVSVSASGADVEIENGGTLTLGPGSYGTLDVGRNATLSLSSGIYSFEDVTLDEGARVEVVLTTGAVLVDVEDRLDAEDDVVIVPVPYGESDARYVTFRVAGHKVDFGKDVHVAAQIVAPDAKVTFGDRARFVGAMVVEDADLGEGVVALFVTVVGPADLLAVGTSGGSADAAEGEAVVAFEAPLPEVFSLAAAYPNPLRQIATVRFEAPQAATVRVVVYDALGREVARLVDAPVEAGRHQATFVSDGLPSGTYLLRMTTSEGFAQTQSITVIR